VSVREIKDKHGQLKGNSATVWKDNLRLHVSEKDDVNGAGDRLRNNAKAWAFPTQPTKPNAKGNRIPCEQGTVEFGSAPELANEAGCELVAGIGMEVLSQPELIPGYEAKPSNTEGEGWYDVIITSDPPFRMEIQLARPDAVPFLLSGTVQRLLEKLIPQDSQEYEEAFQEHTCGLIMFKYPLTATTKKPEWKVELCSVAAKIAALP
jgi:hypothetical protein